MIRLNTSLIDIKNAIDNVPKDTVIAEFSGRDSVAAVMKNIEDCNINNILPIASFAGTENGEIDALYNNHKKLVNRVREKYGNEKTVYPMIIYSNPDLWHALNGRFTSELIKKYGFYTPCIGCHAYFHLLRMPMANQIGKKLISGEREGHESRIKVNQLDICLDTYKKILSHFDVDLLLPIRKITNNKEIEQLIGWDWDEGKEHPECVYSGNYRDKDGKAIFDYDKMQVYLDEFLYPACINLGELLLKEKNPSKKQMIEVVGKCL